MHHTTSFSVTLYAVYLTTLSVPQTIHQRKVRLLINDYSERKQKKGVVAQFKTIFRHFAGRSKKSMRNLSHDSLWTEIWTRELPDNSQEWQPLGQGFRLTSSSKAANRVLGPHSNCGRGFDFPNYVIICPTEQLECGSRSVTYLCQKHENYVKVKLSLF